MNRVPSLLELTSWRRRQTLSRRYVSNGIILDGCGLHEAEGGIGSDEGGYVGRERRASLVRLELEPEVGGHRSVGSGRSAPGRQR